MKVVRQWKTYSAFNLGILTLLSVLASCNPTEITSSGLRQGSGGNGGSLPNKALIYRDSPMGANPVNISMASYVDKKNPEIITTKSQLKSDCELSLYIGSTSLTDCLQTYAVKSAGQTPLTRKADGSWSFPTDSSEFYQVNGHYHVKKGIDTFFEKLQFSYDTIYTNPSFMFRQRSIPKYLPNTGMNWFKAVEPSNDNYFRNSFLNNYVLCNLEDNASFSPAGPELCFGFSSKYSSMFFVQDPSIVYHELGHALVSVMMNMRNAFPISSAATVDYHNLRSNLGFTGYDEGGALNEGIADYFSFVMNQRTHIGEWALGTGLDSSRPLSEDDHLHIGDLDTTPEGRLSYPEFINYDPNQVGVPLEGVHYAGQIVSHYLVALTKTFQNECSIPTELAHKTSTSYTMFLLAETLSELGDLQSRLDSNAPSGEPNGHYARFSNLDEFASYMWTQVVNPPTYRKFFQVFGKNILKYFVGMTGMCPGLTKDESEKLLDDYGLLLFKNYDDNGASSKFANVWHNTSGVIVTTSPAPEPTQVSESNRRKSALISKSHLSLATANPTNNVATYYLIDDAPNMGKILPHLLFKGYTNSSNGVADLKYNNGNVRISPGEIVGVIPNLYNSSNTAMAGVQLLANDWDHTEMVVESGVSTGFFKPFKIDDVTTSGEGAIDLPVTDYPMKDYVRYTKYQSSAFPTRAAAPVCMIQMDESATATKWVSQHEFRKRTQGLNVEDQDCLGYGGTEHTEDFTFNPQECFVRVLPGANRAFYSKIEPQKSYVETMRANNPDHEFGVGNAIIFEISKNIPPGTKFRCRLRATFSNCSDCYNDPTDSNNDGIPDSKKDYLDYEYNGNKPFKIINFEFIVND